MSLRTALRMSGALFSFTVQSEVYFGAGYIKIRQLGLDFCNLFTLCSIQSQRRNTMIWSLERMNA